jgi:hypothetical protein
MAADEARRAGCTRTDPGLRRAHVCHRPVAAQREGRRHHAWELPGGRGDNYDLGAGAGVAERRCGVVRPSGRQRVLECLTIRVPGDDLAGDCAAAGGEPHRGPDQARAHQRETIERLLAGHPVPPVPVHDR